MNYHAVNLINNELLFAAQSPQWLKRCANAQHSKRVLFAAQTPQGLKRCANAQHFLIRRLVVSPVQHF